MPRISDRIHRVLRRENAPYHEATPALWVSIITCIGLGLSVFTNRRSAIPHPSRWLCPKSLYQGAKAAIGHDDIITAGNSYYFAEEFYDLAS